MPPQSIQSLRLRVRGSDNGFRFRGETREFNRRSWQASLRGGHRYGDNQSSYGAPHPQESPLGKQQISHFELSLVEL
jgi:hypothetical protein